MYLKQLSVLNFKNYESAEVVFCEDVNCIVGNNGEGKTNLVDAVYYLSFCKSFFNPLDSQNILRGMEFFMLSGKYDRNSEELTVKASVKKGQKKKFSLGKKEYDKLAQHIGEFPLVMVSPADSSLILEGSDVRRKFIDSIISQFDKKYLDQLISYNRVLTQRNMLLKKVGYKGRLDETTVEVYDEQLEQYGQYIFAKRQQFLTEFIPMFQKHYSFIVGDGETVDLQYKSQLLEDNLVNLLKQSRAKDLAIAHTTCGIHKDDLIFQINDFPVKKFASQGQQKSYLTALKLAQFEYIKKSKGVKPIIVLDDIFDKLDDKRSKRIMQLISDHEFGQIFITDTNLGRLQEMFSDIDVGQKYFMVNKGEVSNAE